MTNVAVINPNQELQQRISEKLSAIVNPENEIISRLQARFGSGSKEGASFGYSRMHNRHNRS